MQENTSPFELLLGEIAQLVGGNEQHTLRAFLNRRYVWGTHATMDPQKAQFVQRRHSLFDEQCTRTDHRPAKQTSTWQCSARNEEGTRTMRALCLGIFDKWKWSWTSRVRASLWACTEVIQILVE